MISAQHSLKSAARVYYVVVVDVVYIEYRKFTQVTKHNTTFTYQFLYKYIKSSISTNVLLKIIVDSESYCCGCMTN